MDPSDVKGRSVFVKLNEYKDIQDMMQALKDKVEQAKGTLEKIKSLKSEEDTELDQWQGNVGEIEKKIGYVEKTLFEPENRL